MTGKNRKKKIEILNVDRKNGIISSTKMSYKNTWN